MFHYGFLKTVDTFEEYAKELDDVKKRLEQAEADTTWQNVSDLDPELATRTSV